MEGMGFWLDVMSLAVLSSLTGSGLLGFHTLLQPLWEGPGADSILPLSYHML